MNTNRTYYGFTHANREEEAAWFHTPAAAARFAEACWPGEPAGIETTSDPEPGSIMDTPDKPWTKNPPRSADDSQIADLH